MTEPSQERERLNRAFDESDPRPQPQQGDTEKDQRPDSAWDETAHDLKSGLGNIKDRVKDTIDDIADHEKPTRPTP